MSTRQILVVEDERIVAAGIRNELEHFGYHVSGVASDAADAVEQAVRDQPDLVLMDIHLNGETDGVEAARQIRARCGTPVVYLSAFADNETVARAADTEAYGYLLKPYEERELYTTIETALAKHDAEKRLAKSERKRAGTETPVESSSVKPTKRYGTQPAVLLAEAEPKVRDFARTILEGQGYQVHIARDGVEAVEVFRRATRPIDLAIIDLNIPRLTADAVLTSLLELDPNVEVIFSSNYFAEDRCDEGSHLLGVISKPYSRQELERTVERAMAVRSVAEQSENRPE